MPANAFVIPNDMSDLCRVCLQLLDESQYLDLTTVYDEEDNVTYGECFTICTQIDLNAGDGVPHNLCKPCGIELQMSYDFHKKIEESKRVIEQYLSQLKKQVLNETESLPNNEQFENLNLNEEENTSTLHLVNAKYVISTNELQNSESSEMACDSQSEPNFIETLDENDEPDEIEVLNVCKDEADLEYQVPSDNTPSNAGINEHFEDDFEIEALEDEETETLQTRVCENSFSIQQRISKSFENGNKAEFVLYAEDLNEKKARDVSREEIDVEFVNELTEKDTEDQLAWQENVVAVANKEHLPLKTEYDEDEEETLLITSEKHLILNDSSQEETVESLEVEEEAENFNIQITEVNEYSANTATGRKRHVGSYSCDYCHRVYPNYSRMKTHRRCHESNRPKFSCTQCGRMYATKQARDCHIQTAHDKSGYVCNICDKVFAIRKSLEIHMRYHTGDFPFACTLCDRKFAQACHLTTHINVKHNQIRFSCDYPNCGKFFTSSSSLRNHEYTHSIMPFECEYCEQGYPAKSKLRIHVQRKHGVHMTNEQLEKMRVFHIMRSKCFYISLQLITDFILGSPFSTQEANSKNQSNFTEETIINTTIMPIIPTGIRLAIPPGPPFICELCGHSTKTKNLLASHRHRKHRQKELPYQCVKCDKAFKSKEQFDKHRRRLSCERYPEFICEYCRKRIIGSANYEIHLRFHKKIYPFKCQDCNKGFMLAVHLRDHIQTKHESRRYICTVVNCGKLYQSQQALKTHTYIHCGSMPFRCEYCKKMFPIKTKLRHHIQRVHSFDVSSQDLDRMLVSQTKSEELSEFLSFGS